MKQSKNKNMNKRVLQIIVCALFVACATLSATALEANHFAQSSRLSQGRWVKVAVTQTGIYEINRNQLAKMGFTDPRRIKVYGYGGRMLSEVLLDDLPDDLQQIPALRRDDKICFYAVGNVTMSFKQAIYPQFTRNRNTYSIQGYYFITEDSEDALEPAVNPYLETASTPLTTSYDYLLHENEMRSLSFTGSELLGEDITHGDRTFDFKLVNISTDSVFLTTRIASKITRLSASDHSSDVYGQFRCYITDNGTTTQVPYTQTAARIKGCTRDYYFYESGEATEVAKLSSLEGNGTLRFEVIETSGKGVMQVSLLDYFIMTYEHHNMLKGQPADQCLMAYSSTSADDQVRVNANSNTQVWDITNPTNPINMSVITLHNQICFTPGEQLEPHQYVAFNPDGKLLQIDSFQMVENQDLHAMSVPDMLIITTNTLMPQAERVAQLHRQHDGLDVIVVDHEKIFNEFSSGTPSAMAYRLLCKMLYDRDKNKFKDLLLVGHSSFDNRGIVTGKKDRLMCYQTSLSNYDDNSHVIEDFFGYLNDNSGLVITSDSLKIGVGRIPSSSLSEAKHDIDKLYEYVLSPDYGVWRNNYCIWAEQSTGDEDKLHEKQADGINYILENDLNIKMIPDKAFVGMFPKDITESFKAENKQSSTNGRKHIQEMLNEGQYFATYVGHAGATSLSATGLWTSNHVLNNSYTRLPIMTTACCDVARFDSDTRGIAELMFHKRDGGAIALYTTTRQVMATMNDDVNRAFVNKMFSYNQTGIMPRLGDCYLASKNCYNTSNSNKFHWVLLGDPALQINYPKPLFKITSINGVNLSSGEVIGASPLQRITVDAQVMQENSPYMVNTHFNGEATFTIYDAERTCLEYIKGTGIHKGDTMSLAYPREKLLQVTGRVVNGKFHGTGIMPRFSRTSNNPMLVSVYAHEDGTENMVNGLYDKLRKNNYNASAAVTDKVSPVIQKMYLNNEQEFAANATVGTQATLYIHATDNTAFNTQQLGMGRNMRLTLDGGKTSYNLAKDLAKVSNEGRQLDIAIPINGLTAGQHTLDFTVSDVCGNMTTQRITFVVSSQNDLRLQASDIASSDEVSIDLTEFALSSIPTINLHITDMNGNIIWSKQTNTFPCTWNLKNNAGQRVPNGLYHIYGNYVCDEGYGGSNLIDFVVLPAMSN